MSHWVPIDLKLCSFQFLMHFTCSLWNSHFPAAHQSKVSFFPAKPHSCQLCTCLRQRNHECGQSDFWKHLSSSECIPRGVSLALTDLGLGFKMNQLMIHLNYFQSFIPLQQILPITRESNGSLQLKVSVISDFLPNHMGFLDNDWLQQGRTWESLCKMQLWLSPALLCTEVIKY